MADFTALATGRGAGAAITSLIQAQRSLVRGLLAAVYQEATKSPAVPEPVKTRLHAAWSVLAAVDRGRPEALASLLSHPYLRAWAVRCLEELRAVPARPDAVALGHLGAVAAAAAARGRVSAVVTVPVQGGAVHLPTIGRLVLGPEPGQGEADGGADPAAVSVISNAVIIQAGDSCWTFGLPGLLAGQAGAVPAPGNGRPGDWQPVRTLRAPGWSLMLDDTDPYRDSQQWPAAPRLPEAEAAGWQRDFQLAWQQIGAEHPAYAAGLAAGLTTLTPLLASPDRAPVSAVGRQAFGAVAASRPADPAALARLFVEEFQRAKLGLILDLFDLYDQADDRLFQAPWGEEKIRLDGLLVGAYTRLASAEWREQTGEAIDLLLDSGALTGLGERFVGEMRHAAARWPADIGERG